MEEELIEQLLSSADFKSQFKFLREEEIIEKYGETLYNKIKKEFSDNWSYELSERLESIDIKALITDSVKKALSE